MTTEGNAWLYKNKDHGMMSAAASLGTILLWNVEEGLMQARTARRCRSKLPRRFVLL